ncbi:MAG: hypothetical protein ACI3VN_05790 [Candidatus Onthomonas sp.]
MKITPEEMAKLVYEQACGETDILLRPELAGLEIENEYRDGTPCDLLYQQFWAAREQAAQGLHGAALEALDVMADRLLDIGRTFALKMFRYGMEAQRLGLPKETPASE